ncbi:hypothetical protein LZ30DRAFT_146990 [Colletotrichum cereale]|nr:hypothetical protein LZ30DRAFT_146990 [Colletotrichum cereale]
MKQAHLRSLASFVLTFFRDVASCGGGDRNEGDHPRVLAHRCRTTRARSVPTPGVCMRGKQTLLLEPSGLAEWVFILIFPPQAFGAAVLLIHTPPGRTYRAWVQMGDGPRRRPRSLSTGNPKSQPLFPGRNHRTGNTGSSRRKVTQEPVWMGERAREAQGLRQPARTRRLETFRRLARCFS